MKSRFRIRDGIRVAVIFAAASLGYGQSVYNLSKEQDFLQTAPTSVVAHPVSPFAFSLSAPANVSVTLPSGAPAPLALARNDDGGFDYERSFATRAAMDAAFPSGIYRISTAGGPTLTLNLTEDYPVDTPQVTQVINGTWNSGGVLVVNPAQSVTLTLNNFSDYAAAGAASFMEVDVWGFTEQDDILDTAIVSRAEPVFGITVQSTPLSSINIPANRLVNGRIYEVTIETSRLPTFDTTTVAGGLIVTGLGKMVRLFIAAQTAGTSPAAPVITTQPASRTATAGSATTFTVAATIAGNPVIQWYKDGFEIDTLHSAPRITRSANGLSLTINSITAADAGDYRMQIVSPGGYVASSVATLTIPVAPVITAQPVAQNVVAGGNATFTVAASGIGNTYQWRKDGVAITGATSSSLPLINVTAANAGNYTVVVTNSLGSVTSNTAGLAIVSATAAGRLINLSILTALAAGGDSFTMGFVVGGPGTGGVKPLLVRVAGPSLAQLGVTGALDDPKLELFAGSNKTGENDNWGGGSELTNAMAAVGAFAYSGANSRDAAAVANITSSDNSVRVTAVGNGSGAVIAELYDATPSGSFSATTPRLVNVSVLKNIGSGLTAGFVIGGSTSKTVLIRAIGPTIGAAPFNVGGVVADPQLALFSGQNKIAENNDWGGTSALAAAFAGVGAFALPATSRDAALVTTLAPGNYTVQVTGVGNTTGTALIEVYDVP